MAPPTHRAPPHSSKSRHQQLLSNPTRPTINPLKKRRRDLLRLLAHQDDTPSSSATTAARVLPADVRVVYERELAACDAEIETARAAAARKAMVGKYHMVRFFERKKATRLLKRARQRLAKAQSLTASEVSSESTNKLAELEAEVHARDVDLNYTLYHPLDEVYSSLYATSGGGKRKRKRGEADTVGAQEEAEDEDEGKDAKDETTVSRASPMWKMVEEATALGSARLQLLRDGKLTAKPLSTGTAAKPAITVKGETARMKKKRKDTNTGAKEGESRHGFTARSVTTSMGRSEREKRRDRGIQDVANVVPLAGGGKAQRSKAREKESDNEDDGTSFFES